MSRNSLPTNGSSVVSRPQPQGRAPRARSQGVYWIGTIPQAHFVPYLPPGICYFKGQLELGEEGFLHWQVLACCSSKQGLSFFQRTFGLQQHWELTRSSAASDYVWKEETCVPGTRFELGKLPFKRNSEQDWDRVRALAIAGQFDSIPSEIYIRHYSSLQKICRDHLQPVAIERNTWVFWGASGTGKSRRAYEEAGMCVDCYFKASDSKWWDGYRGQRNVIIDEFRGGIVLELLLRWTDRYPYSVETKGGAVASQVEKFWITSNIPPNEWYLAVGDESIAALNRRLTVIQF
nr:MAG: replication associated protein [Cressdnaviricota sp.]